MQKGSLLMVRMESLIPKNIINAYFSHLELNSKVP